jgi:EthD domain
MPYKLVYLARRAAAVTREDWPRTWRSHAVFASQFPVLEAKIDWLRYCNRIEGDIPGISAKHDGVAVAASDTLEALNGAGFSEADRALIDTDELRVFDMLTPHFTWYCKEQPILAGDPGEVAVFSFLRRKPELTHEEFEHRWCGQHADIAAAAIRSECRSGGTLTRYTHNRLLHDPLPLFPFDGIAEAWFASAEEAAAAFTGDRLEPLRRDLAEFCDLGQSVTMLTGVCHRWPKN